jgi:protein transport protein SEC61 subunit gamma-like protein
MNVNIARIKESLSSYRRVIKIARKPSTKEYTMVAKVTGLGIILIGIVGLFIKTVSFYISLFGG